MDVGLAAGGSNEEILSHSSPPTTDDIWAIVAALLSGARYGLKIRFPHALVMVFMFRRDLDTRGKLRLIVKAVLEHATSLASFAALYKSILVLGKLWENRRPCNRPQQEGLRQGMSSARALGRLWMDMLVPGKTYQDSYVHIPTSPTTVSSPPPTLVLPGRPVRPFHALVAGAVGGYVVWGRWSTLSHQILLYVSVRVMAACWKLLPIHDEENWRATHRLAATVAWAAVMYLWETSPDVLQGSLRKSMDEIYDSGWFSFGERPLERR